ncbi:MAG: hypothetical protein LDLANPLL_02803 [Turneriella sp.]|nr:hypothetical protein [Turneriella sp.]
MLKKLCWIFLFIAAYIGASFFALKFIAHDGVIAIFWPSTGLALAAMLLGGWTYIPVIFVAATLTNTYAGSPPLLALLLSLNNIAQAVLGCLILKKWRPIDLKISRAIDYFRIFFYTAILLPIPFSIFGTALMQSFGALPNTWQNLFYHWWMGDSLGVSIITPLILIGRRLDKEPIRVAQVLEAVVVYISAFLLGQMVFLEWFKDYLQFTPLAFMMTLFVAWAAIRFGRHITLIFIATLIAQVQVAAKLQIGFFYSHGSGAEIINMWLYISIQVTTGMALATFIHEKKKIFQNLERVTQNMDSISRLGSVGGWEEDYTTGEFWYSDEMLYMLDLPKGAKLTVEESFEAIDENDRAAHIARVQLAIEQQVPWESEFGVTTKKGRHLWVRSVGKAIFQNGKPVKIIGFAQNITERRENEILLQKTNERLSMIFSTISEGVVLAELVRNEKGEIIDQRVIEVNDAFYRLADYLKDTPVIGGLASELFQIPREAISKFWEKHIHSKESSQREYYSERSGNHLIITTSPLRNNQFILSFYDITERKKQEIALKESEERYRKLIESSTDAILVHRGGIIDYANARAAHLLGAKSSVSIIGINIRDIIRLENRNVIFDQSPIHENQLFRLDGTTIPVEISTTEIFFSGSFAVMLIARDISERKHAEERIRYLGQHDLLTQLPNRALLADRIQQAAIFAELHKTIFAILILDIDYFKKINDTLGHYKGDQVLKAAAERITNAVKNGDTVSRQGGDEFVVLLNDLKYAKDAAQSVQKIGSLFDTPFEIGDTSLTVSTSIGVAIYPDDGKDAETLIHNAEIAMYHSKDSGRNQFQFYSADLNRVTHERLELEMGLREAIREGKLAVHYQPQLNLTNGKIESCEALLRWPHPDHGFISPGRFIPIAEETGLIKEIGRWVLSTVAKDHDFFASHGFDTLRISINASAKELQDANFCNHIRSTIATGKISPTILELEVTESMIMQDTAIAARTIRELSELGVRFSIDDFGTGYSSLSYLRELKIHNLKIDQSFVRDLMEDPDDAAIVRTIIGLAKNLRLSVTAEGVETKEQRTFLKENGCDIIQGFELSPALPPNEFVRFLQEKAAS